MSKKKLGRDLGSLLSGVKDSGQNAGGLANEREKEGQSGSGLTEIPLEEINPSSYQPRKSFSAESLNELSESIKSHGLLQPVLVRKRPQGGYELIAGERRWRASKLAGLDVMPAVVRDAIDQEVSALALVENIQRDNLNSYEEASALGRLRDEFGLTQESDPRFVANDIFVSKNITNLSKGVEGKLFASPCSRVPSTAPPDSTSRLP
mgnify:CR=1 FL=1